MFLFKQGLPLIVRRLYFSSNTNFLFSLVSVLKLAKQGEWLQSNKWLQTTINIPRLNFLLSQWWDSGMLRNSYIKVSYTITIVGFVAESSRKFINDTRCKVFWNAIFRNKKRLLFFFLLLNTIFNLQQLKISLRDFINLVLVCNDNSLR